ncbi:MAG: DUF4124 domain-containing protein [Nevskiales bacterium]|nr:DUF4124 domain-containing protein [Nevskiales bacterium]
MMVVPVLACGIAAAAMAADEVYRYVAPDGSVHYTDQPPDPRARPLKLEPLSGATPPARRPFYSLAALQAAARFAVSIESPTPGQQFDAAQLPVVAAASVMPGLVTGFGLSYRVDGAAVTATPVDDLSIELSGLAPGAHELVVALIGADGRERARSAGVVFHVRAPAPN